MNILAMDVSGPALSVALSCPRGLFHTEAGAGGRHAELLMEAVDRLLGLAGIGPGDLDLVACPSGPGSFTGLRIGYATAKGIALALGIPVATAPTLDCLARTPAAWPGLILPVIDAKRGRFWGAVYRSGARLTALLDALPEEIAAAAAGVAAGSAVPVLVTGPGAPLLAERLPAEPAAAAMPGGVTVDRHCARGRAVELLELVRDGGGIADDFAGPSYLRPAAY